MSTDSASDQWREPRLGIDIGRVVIAGPDQCASADTTFFEGDEAAMLATPEMPDAFAAIGRLGRLFGGRVWLVSKCGRRVEERTLRWLASHDFSGRTGVPPEHVRFCRERADKRSHCVDLGLTHLVDDRPDVHEAIRGTVVHQYLFGASAGADLPYVTGAATWHDLEPLIVATLATAVSA